MGKISLRSLLVAVIFLSNYIPSTLGRHHFTHNIHRHRTRHRRQGAGLFLSASYVIPGGEGSGAWGEWGEVSACSRTCGGGVAYQKRICLEIGPEGQPRCTGGDTKYFSCETQDCPDDSGDFRAEQCAAYDNVPFRGNLYQWIPYINALRPCELTCMPRGERFYYRHKVKVVDGTRCNDETPDVCVDGLCQPVGCDMMLGSNAKEDKCRQCRGNGTNCYTTSGVIDTQDLTKGYNDVLLIPKGATNVIISEVTSSNNYLALRGQRDGSYYLNGHYRIDFPRSLVIAGSLWYYDRSQQGFPAPDKLRTLGPTNESLYLSLLLQEDNVGIAYEYSIPSSQAPPPNRQYNWVHGEYSPCSATCGGGIQTREVTCRSREELDEVDESLCDEGLKPATNETCNKDPCPPSWVEGPWSPCSKACGEGGTRSRQVHCEKIIAQGVASIATDKECFELMGPKPKLYEECNENATCPTWFTGPWKPCDKLCGEGKQVRDVICHRRTNGRVELFQDDECEDEKPPSEQACLLHPCDGVDWVLSDWTGCDTCTSKVRARTAQCVTKDFTIVNASLCSYHPQPVLEEPCDTNKLPACEVMWYATQWSNCSVACGKGVQTRRVFCGQFDGEGVTVVEDSLCDAQVKYNTTKECEVPKDKCPAKWFAGPWTECTKTCGGGEQYRRVKCLSGGKVSTDCDEESILDNTQACNVGPCDVDEMLPHDSKSTPIMDEYADYEDCEDEDEEFPEAGDDKDVQGVDIEDSFEFTLSQDNWIVTENSSNAESYGTTDEDVFTTDETETTDSSVTESEVTATDSTSSETSSESSTSSFETTQTSDVSKASETAETASTDSDVTTTASEETHTTEASGTTESESTSTGNTGSEPTTEMLETSTVSANTDLTDSTIAESTLTSTESFQTDTASTTDSTGSTQTSDVTETSTIQTSSTETEVTETTEFSSSSSTEGQSTELTSTVSESQSEETSSTESSSGSTENQTTEDTSTVSQSSSQTEETSSSTEISLSISTDGQTTEVTSTVSESSSQTEETSSSTDISSSISTDGQTTEVTSTVSESSSQTEETSSSTDISSSISTDGQTTEESSTVSESSSQSEEVSSSTEGFTTESSTTESDLSQSTETSVSTESTSEFTSESSSSVTEEIISTTGGITPWDWTSTVEEFTRRARVCRPRPKCFTSKFGCCPDKRTPAAGPFDEGCPNPSTCAETKFGCCSDGVSPANGPNNKGCPTIPCNVTLYGCCESDNKTTALGNDQEGCPPPPPACKQSKYGCCSDNKTEAKGSDEEGCPDKVVKTTTVSLTTEEITTESLTDDKTATSCRNSEFGCCYDNETDASGPNGEGCPCSISEFGCCADGIATAHGPNLEGCVTSCNNSAYGCCQDGETPAHGPQYEGCCLQTAYGCCPDNYKPAQGPHLEGCSCEYAPYGCCPDNKTIARGPNNEGCGCLYTEHGCCPDRHTPANGPEFEGCGCHTYQFGCCPDGVTIAGPNQQGCLCQQSRYGCCGDGISEAKGPNKEGCDCSNSKFGCCPDGKTEAAGERFLNCTDVPENKQAACVLANDRGSGHNYSVYWYYDMTYGGCSRFWYGGEDGNGNRFVSKEECEDVCVHPSPKDACNLPKVKGPCPGYFVKWYYDSAREQCSQFVYGGCLGNNNNFESRELCQKSCEPEKSEDQCNLPIESGSCAGNFLRWGYDPSTRRCHQFIWGGCEGNSNRFGSEAACMQRCNPPGALQAECTQPQEAGNCTEKYPVWSFSQSENRCVPFYYTGCGGNDNRFEREQDCATTCPSAYEQEICTLPALVGECADYTERWFYDTAKKRCRQFYYGGCGGNENNFMSERQCEDRCSEKVVTSTVAPVTTQLPASEFCFLELDSGPCTQEEPRWGYDSAQGRCVRFTYGGCGGNRNNFPSEEYCRRYCSPVQDICQLPMISGPCDDSQMRWFYDATTDSCSQFTYGGCGGNENRFETFEECQHRCKSAPDASGTTTIAPEFVPRKCRVSPTLEECSEAGRVWYYDERQRACLPHDNIDNGRFCRVTGVFPSEESCERSCGAFQGVDVCRSTLDPGTCTDSIPKVYYNSTMDRCEPFTYTGCLGGANRFSSYDECETVCRPTANPCKQPPHPGNCLEYSVKWYYDEMRHACLTFEYSGCNGNENRFDSQEECESRCVASPQPPAILTTTALPTQTTDMECRTPSSLEPCGSNVTVYYFDSNSQACVVGGIGACGYSNSYRSEEECQRRCGAFKGIDVCFTQVDAGPCSDSIAKFYWDSSRGGCGLFTYSGCGGSPNRFSTAQECEEVCGDIRPEGACEQPVWTGEPCAAGGFRRWYYSEATGDCLVFAYSGCGGNANNFNSYEECSERCIRLAPGTNPNCEVYRAECESLQCTEGVVRTRTADGCERCSCNCDDIKQQCDKLNCLYGIEKSGQDENGCTRCRCLEHPCAGMACPAGERCAIISTYRHPITLEIKYSAACRVANKSGVCPADGLTITTESTCRRECNDDADCPEQRKCCTRGCSRKCLEPNWDSPQTTTYAPSTTHTLDLPEPPRPVSIAEPNIRATEGDMATLRCLFHANPPPRITWRKGDIAIDSDVGRYRLLSDGALQIVSLYRNDSGVYICIAQNPLGTATQQITLQVEESNEVIPTSLYCPGWEERCAQLRFVCPYSVQRTRGISGCIECTCFEPEIDRCEVLKQQCGQINCTYGVQTTVDRDGCERCQCNPHPCENKQCSSGEQCRISLYTDSITFEVKYFAECRLTNKEGVCPSDDSYNIDNSCQEECKDDADCLGVGKCCSRGCSRRCLQPLTPTSPAPLTSLHDPGVPEAPVPQNVGSEPKVSSTEGGMATLHCLVHGNPPPKITWRRGEITIDSDVGRYRLLSDGALQIVSLYRNDSGVYICIAQNPLGTATQQITLEVEDPVVGPAGIANSPGEIIYGEIGQPVRIRCLAYGYPEPSIYWFKGINGPMIPYSSTLYEARENVLLIRHLNTDTLGEYVCEAYNGKGKPVDWRFVVSASQPDHSDIMLTTPPPAPLLPREPVTEGTTTTTASIRMPVYTVPVTTRILANETAITSGGAIRLPCEVDGYPVPEVKWTKDGVQLTPSDRIHITESRLTISQAVPSDSGVYGCEASNQYSSDSSTVQILVQGLYIPPTCIDNPYFANCKLIVRSGYCTHRYYSKFCCKSCVEAGHLDPMQVESQADEPFKK